MDPAKLDVMAVVVKLSPDYRHDMDYIVDPETGDVVNVYAPGSLQFARDCGIVHTRLTVMKSRNLASGRSELETLPDAGSQSYSYIDLVYYNPYPGTENNVFFHEAGTKYWEELDGED